MLISIAELREKLTASLVRMGAPLEEAVVGADMCLDAELRAHKSHGVRLMRNVAIEYARGSQRRAPILRSAETPVSVQIDGGFHLSWYVHRLAVDVAVEKALQSGIGLVSVRNAGVSGALGYLVERASQQGLVSMVFASTPLTVVAPDTRTPTLGTNPLAIGLPRHGPDPLVLDMATSAIAFNQVLRLREAGGSLPDGVANGADGSFTNDPEAAIDELSGRGRILPFGGHRGYGLALMLELMVSGGITGRVGDAKRGDAILEPADFSSLYLCFRPELIGEAGSLHRAVDELLAEVGREEGRIPGEQSRRLRERALSEGSVDVDEAALALLE
ncbi:MAG: Ldh family oxidoreductase [Pseudoclavibacter sp.]